MLHLLGTLILGIASGAVLGVFARQAWELILYFKMK